MKNSVKKLKNAYNEAKNCLSRRRVLFCGQKRSKSFSCFSSVLLSRRRGTLWVNPARREPFSSFCLPGFDAVSRQKEHNSLRSIESGYTRFYNFIVWIPAFAGMTSVTFSVDFHNLKQYFISCLW